MTEKQPEQPEESERRIIYNLPTVKDWQQAQALAQSNPRDAAMNAIALMSERAAFANSAACSQDALDRMQVRLDRAERQLAQANRDAKAAQEVCAHVAKHRDQALAELATTQEALRLLRRRVGGSKK